MGKSGEKTGLGQLRRMHLHWGEATWHETHTDALRENRSLPIDSNYVPTIPIGREVQQTENYTKWLNKVHLVVLSKQTYIP